MHPRDLDDFLVDRVFQPVVDRLPASAEVAAGFVSIGAGLCFVCGFALAREWVFVAIVVPCWGFLVLRAHRPRRERPGTFPVERLMWHMRLFQISIAICMSTVAALAPDRTTVLLAAGQWGIVMTDYMLACRRNPPPPKKATVPVASVNAA